MTWARADIILAVPSPLLPETSPGRGPIGVFDSGVGGLAVLRALREALPGAERIYVADSAHAPYGEREAEFIQARSEHIARFLLARGAGALLIACNTATVVAANALRRWCPVPVVAMEPAIKPAAARTRSGRIAVLATRQTVASGNVARLVAAHGARCTIELIACPGLVECVERGEVSASSTRGLVETYLRPALERGADCVVLGCTHYSFLRPLIEDLAGAQVQVLDPAPAVVTELLRRIGAAAEADSQPLGGERFYTSAPQETAAPLISMLWGKKVAVESL
ncbi:glutamate racemase [Burkholderiales bacterium]|nr:glutamate racemase [Burkholderiales bacterium]